MYLPVAVEKKDVGREFNQGVAGILTGIVQRNGIVFLVVLHVNRVWGWTVTKDLDVGSRPGFMRVLRIG